MEDKLGAFDWVCDDGSGSVVFYSNGLKTDKRLADLVSSSGFQRNSVLVKKNGTLEYATSYASDWWSNSVKPLPTGSTDLNTVNAIYILDESRTDGIHNITANGISVVIQRNAQLTGSLSSTATQLFLWIEGQFGDLSVPAIDLDTPGFSQFKNIVVKNISAADGIRLSSPRQLQLEKISGDNIGGNAIYISGHIANNEFLQILDCQISNSTVGVYLNSTNFTFIKNLKSFKNLSHIGGGSSNYDATIIDSTMDFGGYGINSDFYNSAFSGLRFSNFQYSAIRGFGTDLNYDVFSNIVIISSNHGIYKCHQCGHRHLL